MDVFNVPKKVNRHVMKAMFALTCGNYRIKLRPSSILTQVKHQMRKLRPVMHLQASVKRSLNNLTNIGLIERHRHGLFSYSLGQHKANRRIRNSCSPTLQRSVKNGNIRRKLRKIPQTNLAMSDISLNSTTQDPKDLNKPTDRSVAAVELRQCVEATEETQKKSTATTTVDSFCEDTIENSKNIVNVMSTLQINDNGSSLSISLTSDSYTNVGQNTAVVLEVDSNNTIPMRPDSPVEPCTDDNSTPLKDEEHFDNNIAAECPAQNEDDGSGQGSGIHFFFGQPE